MNQRAPTTTYQSIVTLRPTKILGDVVIFLLASAVLTGFIWMVFSS